MNNSAVARWLKPIFPRDPHEKNRVATSLELLFDLIFVVAIATAGQQLHHSIVNNHIGVGLEFYLMVFFALWWAWMNFSWFASAYDNDDAVYRILTFVQIIGSMTIAAGIPQAFETQNFDIIVLGYCVMRAGLIIQWLRVACHDVQRRATALRYAVGIALVQLGWLGLHFSPLNLTLYIFIILALAELSVPVWAESKMRTPWHAHHIAERYSLLTLIVLGESVVGCFVAISDALENSRFSTELIFLMIGGLVMMFTMWWAYFDSEIAERLNSRKRAFIWGYGHFFVFVSIAALGAGLAAAVEVVSHEALVSSIWESYFVAIALVIYTTSLYVLHEVHGQKGWKRLVYPFTVIAVLCIPLFIPSTGYAIFAMALVYALRLVLSKQYLTT
jgi:low temperature requirement protein LtrA